jgi:hypothetical protein
MPMNSKYSRPLAATPTMPSTIATITSSRKRAIIRSSAQLGGSWLASAFFAVFHELPSRRAIARIAIPSGDADRRCPQVGQARRGDSAAWMASRVYEIRDEVYVTGWPA